MKIFFTDDFNEQIVKTRDKKLKDIVYKHIRKIEQYPKIGKPLKYKLSNYRSVRVSSFRLIYKIENDCITFIYFDKRDNIYEKLVKYLNYNFFYN